MRNLANAEETENLSQERSHADFAARAGKRKESARVVYDRELIKAV